MITIPERTFKFGVTIVKLAQNLPKNSLGFAISSQIIRSGTSVEANVEESQNAGSKKEFIRGMTIALKEARETYYWLRNIRESDLIKIENQGVFKENLELIIILTSSVKNAKNKI